MRPPPAAGATYNTNSLAHFAATATSTVWPPPLDAANQLRGQITAVLRSNRCDDGVSLRTIDAVLKGFSVIDISNEIGRMSDEGQPRSQLVWQCDRGLRFVVLFTSTDVLSLL